VGFKGSGDRVTEMDLRIQSLILVAIARDFPGDGVLAEEGDPATADSLPRQFDEYVWFDRTAAVSPLGRVAAAAMPETYPFGR
jgi:3'-phosphoadenosine 5'-phosphosulfate (PAPS) 3'-phosphatase